MGRVVGGRLKREGRGTYVYPWLIQVDAWQKPTQYYKAIILQLKITKLNFLKEEINLQNKQLMKLNLKKNPNNPI